MQFESDDQLRAYASIAAQVDNSAAQSVHPNARRSDRAWAQLDAIPEQVLEQELGTASVLFFAAGSTGRRYLSELSDILRCAKRDSYVNDKLDILFSKGVHLDRECAPLACLSAKVLIRSLSISFLFLCTECLRRYLCFKVRASIARKSHLPKDQQIPIQYMTLRDIATDLVTITKHVVDLTEQEARKLTRKLYAVSRSRLVLIQGSGN